MVNVRRFYFILFSTFIIACSITHTVHAENILLAVEPVSGEGSSIVLTATDQAMADQLSDWGYNVSKTRAKGMDEEEADGKDLILISASSVNTVGREFVNLEKPMLVSEAAAYNRFKMTARSGKTVEGQTVLNIVFPEHPISAGHTGEVTVTSQEATFYYGELPDGATAIATIQGDEDKAAVFSYDTDDMMNGMPAPAKRVGFFLHEETFSSLNDNGLAMFKAAVEWALQPSPGDTTAPTVPAGLRARDIRHNEIRVSWRSSKDNTSVASYDIYIDGEFLLNTPSTSIIIEDLQPETEYSITIKARDSAGNVSEASDALSVTTTARGETTPVPPDIAVVATGPSSVLLAWGAIDLDPMAYYDLYLNGTLWGSTRSTKMLVVGLAPETTHEFYAKTRNSDDIRSDASATIKATTTARTAEIIHNESAVGTNLSGINDWSTNQPFVNMAKTMRPWGNENQNGMDVDVDGYLRSINNTSKSDEETSYFLWEIPQGRYILDWEGEGLVEYQGGSKTVVEQGNNHILYDFKHGQHGQLMLRDTDPNKNGNYVHNIVLN